MCLVKFFKIFLHFFSNLVVNKLWQYSKLLNFINNINLFFCWIKVDFCVLFTHRSLLKTQRFAATCLKYLWFSDFFLKLSFHWLSCKKLVNNVILMKNEHFCLVHTACKWDHCLLNLLKTSIFILNTTCCCKCTALHCFWSIDTQCTTLLIIQTKSTIYGNVHT